MRTLDRGELIAGFRLGRLASFWWKRDGHDQPAGLVLAQPAEVGISRDHLMWHPDVDVPQARRRHLPANRSSHALRWTFDCHWRHSTLSEGDKSCTGCSP